MLRGSLPLAALKGPVRPVVDGPTAEILPADLFDRVFIRRLLLALLCGGRDPVLTPWSSKAQATRTISSEESSK